MKPFEVYDPEDEIQMLATKLAAKDAQIKELQEEVYARGQLLAEKDAEIERLTIEWNNRGVSLDGCYQRIAALEAENERLAVDALEVNRLTTICRAIEEENEHLKNDYRRIMEALKLFEDGDMHRQMVIKIEEQRCDIKTLNSKLKEKVK